MKHVVIQDQLHEQDIRPSGLLSTFRDLSIEEATKDLLHGDMIKVNCPACDSTDGQSAFTKNGFEYLECSNCASVYVSLRPGSENLAHHRRHSKATQFRAEKFLTATGQSRRFHVLHSNALWMGRLYDEIGITNNKTFADFGTNYPVIFDEIKQLELFDQYYSIDPLPGLEEECANNGASLEQPETGSLGLLSAFEQLERLFSPAAFLEQAHRWLAPKGMLAFTTRTISGFDLQVLWEKVPYIYVPEHLNLLSTEGISILLAKAGFELIELSTPGRLDLELVQHTINEDPTIQLPKFIDYMMKKRAGNSLEDFQAFLQRNRLSSHVRVAAVKK